MSSRFSEREKSNYEVERLVEIYLDGLSVAMGRGRLWRYRGTQIAT